MSKLKSKATIRKALRELRQVRAQLLDTQDRLSVSQWALSTARAENSKLCHRLQRQTRVFEVLAEPDYPPNPNIRMCSMRIDVNRVKIMDGRQMVLYVAETLWEKLAEHFQ